ncbi:MAG: hypothetical protein ABFD24_06050 [Anaerolineaceae bacterium]
MRKHTLNSQFVKIESGIDEKIVQEARYIIQHHVDLANKIDRDELLLRMFGSTGVSADRKIQMIVSLLNARGDPICPDRSGGGYFWAVNDLDLFLEFIKAEHNRGVSILTKTSAMISNLDYKHRMEIEKEIKKVTIHNDPAQMGLFG